MKKKIQNQYVKQIVIKTIKKKWKRKEIREKLQKNPLKFA